MGNKKSQKKRNKQKNDGKKTKQKVIEQQQYIDKYKLLIDKQKLQEQKHIITKQSITNCAHTIGLILWYLAIAVTLLVAIVSFFLCIYLYCIGNNKFAMIVLTVFQVLTGISSLVVGIWGLVLTINAHKDSEQTKEELNMKTSYSGSIRDGFAHESDVDLHS